MSVRNIEIKNLNKISIAPPAPTGIDRALISLPTVSYYCVNTYTNIFTGAVNDSRRIFFHGFCHVLSTDANGNASPASTFNAYRGSSLYALLGIASILGGKAGSNPGLYSFCTLGNSAGRTDISCATNTFHGAGWHSVGIYINRDNQPTSWVYVDGVSIGTLSILNRAGYIPNTQGPFITMTSYIPSPTNIKRAHFYLISGEDIVNNFSSVDFADAPAIMDNFIDTSTRKPKFGGVDGSDFLGIIPTYYQSNQGDVVQNDVDGEQPTYSGTNAATPPVPGDDDVTYV